MLVKASFRSSASTTSLQNAISNGSNHNMTWVKTTLINTEDLKQLNQYLHLPRGTIAFEVRPRLMLEIKRNWPWHKHFSQFYPGLSLIYLCPLRAAWWRGVYPVLSTQFTLGPLQILLRIERIVRQKHNTYHTNTTYCSVNSSTLGVAASVLILISVPLSLTTTITTKSYVPTGGAYIYAL